MKQDQGRQRPEPRAEEGCDSGPSLEVQHLWYESRRHGDSRSMALLAVDEGAAPVFLARGFATLAAQELNAGVLVVDASMSRCTDVTSDSGEGATALWARLLEKSRRTTTSPGAACGQVDVSELSAREAERALIAAPGLLRELTDGSRGYRTVIFALDSVLSQPNTIQLARAVDGVVLCVRLGRTAIDAAQRVTEIIGRERILGSVALRPPKKRRRQSKV